MSPIPPEPRTARAWHCTSRLAHDGVLVRSDADRRSVVTAILKHGRRAGLIAYAVVDTHMHCVFVCERGLAGEAMRRIELSCHRRLGLGQRFDGARIRPIRDQGHLRNVIPYVLNQVRRHELQTDSLQEGSALHDLLGLRVPGLGLPDALQAELPRVVLPSLWRQLGVEPELTEDWARGLDPAELPHLREAAQAAFALRFIGGRGHPLVRAAMVQAAGTHSIRVTARAAGVARSTIARLRAMHVPTSWIHAIRRQVRLRCRAKRLREQAPSASTARHAGSPR